MAKAKIDVEGDAPDDELRRNAEELAGLNVASGGDLFRAIDELASTQGVMMQFTRVTPHERAGYVGQISVSEFSLEHAKKVFGSGRYVVKFKGPKGYVPGGGGLLIAEDESSTAKPGGSDIASFIEMMDRRDREAKAEKSEKLSRLTELGIPALATIAAALINRPQGTDVAALVTALKPQPGPSLADITATMSNLQTLTAGNQKTDPLDQLIRVAEAVKNLAGDSGGEGGGKSTWVDVLRDLVRETVPAVKPMLENLAESQRAAMLQRGQQLPLHIQPIPKSVAAPMPSGTTVPNSPTPATTDISMSGSAESVTERAQPGETDMFEIFAPMIRQQCVKLTQWAMNNYNPETYSEVFINELPPMVWNYMTPENALEQLNRPDWFEQVVNFHAMLKPYRSWCDEFRQELIVLVTELMDDAANENSVDKPETIAKSKVVQPQIVDEFKDTGE